jgi:hypothetical protein
LTDYGYTTNVNIAANMDIDDEDDLYAPEEPKVDAKGEPQKDEQPTAKPDDLEEGEEEDEGDAAMDEDDDDESDSVRLGANYIWLKD